MKGTLLVWNYSRSENGEGKLNILLSGRVVQQVRIHGRRKLRYIVSELKTSRQAFRATSCKVGGAF
jgi:hypothetical protein